MPPDMHPAGRIPVVEILWIISQKAVSNSRRLWDSYLLILTESIKGKHGILSLENLWGKRNVELGRCQWLEE